jgi:hypothetical protein
LKQGEVEMAGSGKGGKADKARKEKQNNIRSCFVRLDRKPGVMAVIQSNDSCC